MPITDELQQKLTPMSAVRKMPDPARDEMTIGAGHDVSVKTDFGYEIVLLSDNIGGNTGFFLVNSVTCIGPTRKFILLLAVTLETGLVDAGVGQQSATG